MPFVITSNTYPFHAIPHECFFPIRPTPLKLRRSKAPGIASTRGEFFIKGGGQVGRDLALGGAGASSATAKAAGGMKFAKATGQTTGSGYFSSSHGAAGALKTRLSEVTGGGLPFAEQEKAGAKGLGAQLMASRKEEAEEIAAKEATQSNLLAVAVAGLGRAAMKYMSRPPVAPAAPAMPPPGYAPYGAGYPGPPGYAQLGAYGWAPPLPPGWAPPGAHAAPPGFAPPGYYAPPHGYGYGAPPGAYAWAPGAPGWAPPGAPYPGAPMTPPFRVAAPRRRRPTT